MPAFRARLTVLVIACGLIACQRSRPAGAVSAQVHADADTASIDLSRPTLIAYFVTTQVEVDSDPSIGEALSDFQFHLQHARPRLESLGVQVIETYRDSVFLHFPGQSPRFYRTVDSDSNQAGYHLFRPGATPVTLLDVYTDSDLLKEAESYFSAPAP